jgi:hypothetical protein
VRNALAHGRGKLKLLTIPYIADMLKKGILFHTETESCFTFYNYAHRLTFENDDHIAIIVIREDFNGKRFYDNEFIKKIKSADGLDYSQDQPGIRQITCAHPSTGSILQNILSVK